MGKGYALRAGFSKAKGDVIVTIDSDGSHLPEELSEVLAPVLQDRADLVIGSRYMNHKRVAARNLNVSGVKLFNRFIQMLTGVVITDSQSGYRAMKREVLKGQKLKSGTYEIESEILVKTARRNFRITEVPISFEQRTYGSSGVDPMVDGFKIWVSIVSAFHTGLRMANDAFPKVSFIVASYNNEETIERMPQINFGIRLPCWRL